MPLFRQNNRSNRSNQNRSPGRASRSDAAASSQAAASGQDPVQAPAGTGASALLKRYRPLETRAAGGFGSVEICLDSRLKRRVAIKRMPLGAQGDPVPHETTATALAEARTASMLQHPNIVQVIDFTYDDAYAYLVMEYVDGLTLEEFLEGVPGHSLTFDECAAVADALVQALSFAHENGVLHLDIKPANVLIDRAGHVKLTDFGMAALASSAGFGGARGGTIGYMAPEQLRGDSVDERSDVFSLACVLYESLCAEAPFKAATVRESLRLIERGVTSPRDLLPDLPERAEEALLQALSPRPEDRMASVQAFGDRFLPRLGQPREGRRSLARIIASLTADEDGAEGGASASDGGHAEAQGADTRRGHGRARAHAEQTVVDPAEGHLGSHLPRARAALVHTVSGLSCGLVLWRLLESMAVERAPAVLAAVACGLSAAAAPQLGSALCLGGLLALMAEGATLSSLPLIIVASALAAAWWWVWGRDPKTSAMAGFGMALAAATGDLTCTSIAAALAGFILSPGDAAAATAAGALAGAALVAVDVGLAEMEAAAGATGAAIVPADLAMALVGAVLMALSAAGTSALLDLVWRRYLDGRPTWPAIAAACLLPFASALACALLGCLAQGLPVTLMEIADEVLAGALSSIMASVCVYALGYRRDEEEGGGR